MKHPVSFKQVDAMWFRNKLRDKMIVALFKLVFFPSFSRTPGVLRNPWRLDRNVTVLSSLVLTFTLCIIYLIDRSCFRGRSSLSFQRKIPQLNSQSDGLENDYSDKCTAVFTKPWFFLSPTHLISLLNCYGAKPSKTNGKNLEQTCFGIDFLCRWSKIFIS